jgi:hypothetical protein
MSISTTQYTVATSHGSLAVEEHGKGGTPVLLIHGNSSYRGVFQHQLRGQFAENYRFIAFDLPGHERCPRPGAEIEAFVQAIFGDSAQPFLCDAVTRADPRFRKTLFEAARTGAGFDQRLVVESGPALFAVVNGGSDNIVNLDYFDTSHTPIYGKENVIDSEDSGMHRSGKGRIPRTIPSKCGDSSLPTDS